MTSERAAKAGVAEGVGATGARSLFAGHGHLLRGSAWLVTSVAANAIGGFAFWLVAARVLDSQDDVGRAAALWTSVLLVNYATNMGLPVAVARYAPDRDAGSRSLFAWSMLYTTTASVLGSVLFLVFAPADVTEPLSAWALPVQLVVFTVLVVGMSLAVLVEVRLMALRRWGWVFTRAALVGLVRLPLVFFHPGDNADLWLFLLIAGAPAISGFVGAAVLGKPVRRHHLWPVPPAWRAALRYSWINYVGVLAVQAPTFVLPPLIVAPQVSDASYADFYVAFSITTVIFLVPHTLGQVLLVEGGKGGASLAHQVRLGLVLATGLMVVVAVLVQLGSGLLTVVYGEDYQSAADILPTMVTAGVAWAVTSIYLTKARVEENASAIVTIAVTLAVAILVPALVLTSRDGIEGAAQAWLLGNVIAAAVAVLVSARARVGRGTLASDAAWSTAVRRTARPPDAVAHR